MKIRVVATFGRSSFRKDTIMGSRLPGLLILVALDPRADSS
ncbi:MAG: hypothetical protein WD802_05965 [Gemmatimonadaceae bacterium]